MLKLKCVCCQFEQTFTNAEEALHAGWDAPPYFTFVFCDLCPAAPYAFGKIHWHDEVHQRWAKDGRPVLINDGHSIKLGQWKV